MYVKRMLSVFISAALLCGCGGHGDVEETAVSMSETTASTQNEYAVVRNWTGDEMLDSIFYCGEYHPLPLSPEENDNFTLSGDILIFSDGSYADVLTDENGEVVFMKLESSAAPSDFLVCGVGFDSHPDDIYEKIGIAEAVYGDKSKEISYSFYGGGISELTFVYNEMRLKYVYIRV